MKLDWFYMFLNVAEKKSIRKASEVSFTSCQNISKELIAFEKELGTKLYERTNKGIVLTDDGEIVYEKIKHIVSDIDDLRRQFNLQDSAPQKADSLEIYACPILATYVSPIIKTLFHQFPDVPINDHQVSRVYLNRLLCQDKKIDADIILTNVDDSGVDSFSAKTKQRFNCYFMYKDELCIQVPKNSIYAQYDKITYEMLSDMPLLSFTLETLDQSDFVQFLARQGVTLHNISGTANLDTCSQMAINTGKCCFVGYPSAELRPLPNAEYIPLEKPYYFDHLLLIKKSAQNRACKNVFLDIIDQYFDIKQLF